MAGPQYSKSGRGPPPLFDLRKTMESTPKSRRAWIAGGVLFAMVAGYLAVSAGRGGKGPQKGPPPAPVLAAQSETADVPVTLAAIGSVQARASVAIKSRVDGHLLEAHFREGQTVAKDDLLLRIDPRPFAAQLKQAEAALARDRAQLAKAKADLSRYGSLTEKGFASRQKYEEAQAAVDSLAATIRADEAAVELARLQLEYTTIRAPIGGRAGSLLVAPGNLVKAGDAQPLVVINETRPVYVSFTLPEQHLNEIRRRMAEGGIAVDVRPSEDRGQPVAGVVDFVNNAVDPATGTIGLRATIANQDERLLPGQFVTVRVTMNTLKGAVVVPSQAIQNSQKGQYVYVVKAATLKDGRGEVEQRYIKPGPAFESKTVVAEGVAAGETVIVEGQMRLQPGGRVVLRSDKAK
ncbi:MAG: efflux RND transporter periplasmic adaptor subunit [Alphaproteobacteria bacterium]|nr:efflux RND transporter periplasmic adaptor subunit [Alphaproteobacteria bacterium]